LLPFRFQFSQGFRRGSPPKLLSAFIVSYMLSTCSAHHSVLHFVILSILAVNIMNLLEGVKGGLLGRKVDNFTAICEPIFYVENVGVSTSHKHMGFQCLLQG
jgi:hypothetical protein